MTKPRCRPRGAVVLVGGRVPALAHRPDQATRDDPPSERLGPVRPVVGVDDLERRRVHAAVHVEADGHLVAQVVGARSAATSPDAVATWRSST